MKNIKELRKKAAAVALAGAMGASLVGCNSNDKKEKTTTATAITTEATNTDDLQEAIQIETEYDYTQDVRDLYEENIGFWEYFATVKGNKIEGTNDVEPLSEEEVQGRIKNVLKVMNGDVKDLSGEDIDGVYSDIQCIMLPDVLSNAYNDATNAELGYYTIEGNMNIPYLPKLSKYTLSEQTRTMLEEYESNVEAVINDLVSSNKVSDATKEKLTNTLRNQEESVIMNSSYMEVSNASDGLIRHMVCYNNANIYAATGKTRITSDKVNSGEMRISVETEEEAIVYSMYLMNEIETLTDDQKLLLQDLLTELRPVKDYTRICEYKEQIKTAADANVNVIVGQVNDKKTTLLAYKDFLLSAKENINNDDEMSFTYFAM